MLLQCCIVTLEFSICFLIILVLIVPALTKAYSLHDLRPVVISNKSEFNTAQLAQYIMFYHGVNQAFMVSGHNTKYE